MKKNEKGTFVCPEVDCGKMYSYYEGLRRHRKKVHENQDLFRCDTCGCKFASSDELKVHEARHDGAKAFKCDVPGCGKSYDFKSKLEAHKRGHEHACDALGCNEIFLSHSLLRKHISECHKEDLVCNECGKMFTQSNNFRCHLRVHEEDRVEIACPEPGCDRKYAYKKNLRQHLRIAHAENGKLQCEFCQRLLSTTQKLEQHMKSFHSPENPKPLPVTGARALRRLRAGQRSVMAILTGVTPSSTLSEEELLKSAVSSEHLKLEETPDSSSVISSALSSSVRRTEVAVSRRAAKVKTIDANPVLMSLGKRRRKEKRKNVGEDDLTLKAWQGVFREK